MQKLQLHICIPKNVTWYDSQIHQIWRFHFFYPITLEKAMQFWSQKVADAGNEKSNNLWQPLAYVGNKDVRNQRGLK
jgi:hypothetical protein